MDALHRRNRGNRRPTMDDQFKGFFAGMFSGVVKMLVGHPFDTIKVRLQIESSSTFCGPIDCLFQTIRKEGVLALYKGASPPLIGWALMDSVHMGRHLFQSQTDQKIGVLENAISGLGAGLVVSFVATPIEIIKSRLQIQKSQLKLYHGPIDCARKLIKQHGIPGLYKGLSGCLLFRSFFWCLWGSYHVYNSMLSRMDISPNLIPFISGGLAANTFWMISFPADTIKNKMMASTDKNFRSITSTVKWIWNNDGVKGFYRGFLPCMLRSFPTNGAAILVYEFCMNV